jgi:signal transduction histidine kinase
MVLGVVLPMGGVFASVMIAGSLFRSSLIEDLDRRLLAQAAVESVSLFDGPDGRPHVHLPDSPLAAEVATFAPVMTLIDPQGHLVASAPVGHRPDVVQPLARAGHSSIESTPTSRALSVGVMRKGEGVYTLRLEASIAPVEATMAVFYRDLGGTVAAIALALTALLAWQARRLARRVTALIDFVPMIRNAVLPPEMRPDGADELTQLGVVLTDAARFHFEQHRAQERFLANAAHQLRTPLAVLRTEIDLALRRPRQLGELKEALEMARAETERLTLLARKLLDFERLRSQEVDFQLVDAVTMVADIVTRYASVAARKSVRLQHSGVTACLRCDPLLVSQALENVVDNALRFAPDGSQVDLITEVENGECRFLVRDLGPGITEEERPRVFEPFYRGVNTHAQTGLGLAFVADVARMHGGRAWVLPMTVGTGVVLMLPCA